MKILITSDLYLPSVNGVVTSVLNLIEELEKKGHEVRVLTISSGHHSYREGLVYYIRSIPLNLYPGIRLPYSYHNSYIDELISWKPDIIHSQCEFFSFTFAKHISRKTGAPLVHTYHTLYEQYASYVIPSKTIGDKLVAIMSRERLEHVDAIIAPTGKVKVALEKYNVKNKIAVIPTGIATRKFSSNISYEDTMVLKESLGIPSDNAVLISIGRLGTEKNIGELIRNFSELRKTRDNIYFVIVGGGPAEEELRALSTYLNLDDRIIFTGMVKPDEVSKYYNLGDIFVCASTSETQGLTYIEAMANFLPLVCRKDPCLDGVIIDDINGVQYTNSEEYVNAINAILDHPSRQSSVAFYDKDHIENFSKKTFAENVYKLYEKVLSEEK